MAPHVNKSEKSKKGFSNWKILTIGWFVMTPICVIIFNSGLIPEEPTEASKLEFIIGASAFFGALLGIIGPVILIISKQVIAMIRVRAGK
ncbi:hypothetical protein OAE97_02900 [Verrucomicrobia bacterium]|nr:hypothetical protein [Verrucomicrobiota bacterium]MDG1890735.1 hypothetical protein [Verrucomicrobiota bacterium]